MFAYKHFFGLTRAIYKTINAPASAPGELTMFQNVTLRLLQTFQESTKSLSSLETDSVKKAGMDYLDAV